MVTLTMRYGIICLTIPVLLKNYFPISILFHYLAISVLFQNYSTISLFYFNTVDKIISNELINYLGFISIKQTVITFSQFFIVQNHK